MAIAKEQLKQIISENDIHSVADIYALFKDSFKDMLQELLEAEMEASIGYPKHEKEEMSTTNKRDGYFPKTVKSQYGEIPLDISYFISYYFSIIAFVIWAILFFREVRLDHDKAFAKYRL